MDINEYANLLKLDQKVTLHGNYSDSIPYYQITIPIKSRNDLKAFLLKKIKKMIRMQRQLSKILPNILYTIPEIKKPQWAGMITIW